MDRETWRVTVQRVARIGHDLTTKPSPIIFVGLPRMFFLSFSIILDTRKHLQRKQFIVTISEMFLVMREAKFS